MAVGVKSLRLAWDFVRKADHFVIYQDLLGTSNNLPVAGATDVGTGTVSSSFTILNVKVAGKAIFYDVNSNGSCDAGDKITVPFNADVRVTDAATTNFTLPVASDSFGTGTASITTGSQSNTVDVILGSGPTIRSRQIFNPSALTANSPSGIDISGAMTVDAIESSLYGTDAVPSTPIDIIPGFVGPSNIAASNITDALLLDIYRNGRTDLIVATSTAAYFYENWLTDRYSTPHLLVSGNFSSLATGDFNKDGYMDMALGKNGAANLIYFGTATDTFNSSGQALANNATVSLTTLDYDRDGDEDLLAGNASQANILYVNNGSGSFSAGQTMGTSNTRQVISFDINKDAQPDIIEVTDDSVFVWRNYSGTFVKVQTIAPASFSPYSVTYGDIDKDGDPDLIIANDTGPSLVYRNNGYGTFTDTCQIIGAGATRQVHLFDYDCDGDLDLVIGNNAIANELWLNNGSGTFASTTLSLGSGATKLFSYDKDEDGDQDLITLSSSQISVYRNSLSGTWGTLAYTLSSANLGGSIWKFVTVCDVDRDGDMDILANDDDLNYIYRNAGLHTFYQTDTFGYNASQQFATGDINRDGYPDFVFSSMDPLGSRITLNNGFGLTGSTGNEFNITMAPTATTGDFNRDGFLDFAYGHYTNSIYLFNGDGTKNPPSAGACMAADPRHIIAADLNKDGYDDLISFNVTDESINFFRNFSGFFMLSATQFIFCLGGPNSGCLGDINGDGYLDAIAFTDSRTANQLFYFNRYDGDFDTAGSSSMPSTLHNTKHGAAADLDFDGHVDLVIGNYGEPNRIYMNDGWGNLVDPAHLLGGNDLTQWVAVADLDNDGDWDIIFADEYVNIRVYYCN